MNAANSALEISKDLFPQSHYQRHAISRSLRHQFLDDQTNIDDMIKSLKSNSFLVELDQKPKMNWT